MRARLALTVLAVTAMVTIAFLIPLAAVVRVVAADRALSAADQESRALAGVLAAVSDRSSIAAILGQLNAGNPREAAVFLADGTRIGAAVTPPPDELALARSGRAFTASSPGGWRDVWVPVREPSGAVTAVVVAVPASLLGKGVDRSWGVMGVVGVLVLLVAVGLSDRLARSMVTPIEALGEVTRQLQGGDLDARVVPDGPPEVVDVGHAVNSLAERIGDLLAMEREAAADLSHRLRTPLTALQLEADGLRNAKERARLSSAVGDLTDAVTEVIREARQPRSRAMVGVSSDLGAVVRTRLAFWSVLAEDQGRTWEVSVDSGDPVGPVGSVGSGDHVVTLSDTDLAAAIDALITNVFSHTTEGTAFRVRVIGPVLVVEDDGPGFAPGVTPARGRSGGGSTGLGLDIVRRTAEGAGGAVRLGASPSGGARVEVAFGPARPVSSRAAPAEAGRPRRRQ
jgi:signal transduction histidine kinase